MKFLEGVKLRIQENQLKKEMKSKEAIRFQRFMDREIAKDQDKKIIYHEIDKAKTNIYSIISICDVNGGKAGIYKEISNRHYFNVRNSTRFSSKSLVKKYLTK